MIKDHFQFLLNFRCTEYLLVPRKLLQRFSIVFLLSDWLKSSHLRSLIERGFLDILSRHIFCAVTETIRVTNYTTNALKLIEKCFLDLRNIFLNQENVRKFVSKQEDLSS